MGVFLAITCVSPIGEVAIQGAVLDGLGDMFRRDVLESCQIGQGARHLDDSHNTWREND